MHDALNLRSVCLFLSFGFGPVYHCRVDLVSCNLQSGGEACAVSRIPSMGSSSDTRMPTWSRLTSKNAPKITLGATASER
eukprot:759445-Prymnesium_polylepis.2